MSYTVLARKWRPRQFEEMIGQEHVLRALVNSLEHDRLHHAYLFTGTRGVGKTTVARVLAKALNCETGITPRPCGVCRACTEIDQGRFVDLIEVDAASRTKVDDTRELLDNVQYAPTHGRYKVYLIDEVHMLSTHSFNALLKTLEEPPPHVKFLLATTDPQKLPVTVLSRCLQFNLKRLSPELLASHLARLCEAEEVPAEVDALALIAAAARGSVRDSLSLLDQAIAYGGGRLSTAEVGDMLGTIDRDQVLGVLEALARGDGRGMLTCVAAMDERAPDYDAGLQALAELLQRIAVMQLVDPDLEEGAERAALQALAEALTPEAVQLYHQIALLGRRELALADGQRGAFEMTLLRMLAMQPAGGGAGDPIEAVAPASGPARTPVARSTQTSGESQEDASAQAVRHSRPSPAAAAKDDWAVLIAAAGLRGAALQLASHCALMTREGHRWRLALDEAGAHMNTVNIRSKLEQELSAHLGEPIELVIGRAGKPAITPARQQARARDARLQAARESLAADPNVRALEEAFDATLHLESIRPWPSQDS